MGDANANSGGNSDNNSLFFILWIITAVSFLLCPFVLSANNRKLWAARIRERRWNVQVDLVQDSSWYRGASERYERALAAERGRDSPLTASQEEEIRQLFLVKQLSKYTSTISVNAIEVKSNVDKKDSGDTTSISSGEGDIESGATQPNSQDDIETVRSQRLSSEDSDDILVEFNLAHQVDAVVTVPEAGKSVLVRYKTRQVTNGCAICLCEFEPGDLVNWAANKDCPHVFHSECILNWFLASGRREQKRRRHHPEPSTGDPLNDVVTFPMLCPCCRQQYVEKAIEDEVLPSPSNRVLESPSGTDEDPPSLSPSSNSSATGEAPPFLPLSNSAL